MWDVERWQLRWSIIVRWSVDWLWHFRVNLIKLSAVKLDFFGRKNSLELAETAGIFLLESARKWESEMHRYVYFSTGNLFKFTTLSSLSFICVTLRNLHETDLSVHRFAMNFSLQRCSFVNRLLSHQRCQLTVEELLLWILISTGEPIADCGAHKSAESHMHRHLRTWSC